MLAILLIALWVLAMIALPILRWTVGDRVLPYGSSITVCLLAAAVFVSLRSAWGTRKTAVTFVTISILTWGVEWVGSNTGFPFGHYDYTKNLQPQLLEVPLLIPLAWFMMLPPAWGVAQALGVRHLGSLSFAITTGLAFTAWDLFLDPQMVAWGFWEWARPGGYFGIPWINFAGWFATATLITYVVRPPSLPVLPFLTIYTVTWFLQTIGLLVFWQMPGPAIAGFLGMGLFAIPAWWCVVRTGR